MKHFYNLLVLVFMSQALFAETLTGVITDGFTREPLIGVTVLNLDNNSGTITDFDGAFSLEVTSLPAHIKFSYVGYQTEEKVFKTIPATFNLMMQADNEVLDEVVVTAGRFEQRMTDVTVSIEVVKPEALRSQAPTDLSATLQTLPGVEVIDKQPSIRGGGGWTYSVGSRCQVLMDGMTILNPKTGEINWNNVPLENVAQVEVVKGASSVLYGSSALNGVINVRTQRPGLEPETKISGYVGVYDNYKNYSYTGSRLPLYFGAEASHSRRVGNFDISGAISGFKDEGFRKQGFNDRVRFGGNMTYHMPTESDKYVNMGFNLNYVANRFGDFFIWRSPKDPLRPSPLTNMGRNEHNFNIDPFFNYDDVERGISHKLRTRFYVTSDNITQPSGVISTRDLLKWGLTSFDMDKVMGYVNEVTGYMNNDGMDLKDALLVTFKDIAVPITNEDWMTAVLNGIDLVQNGLGYTGTIAELQDAVAYGMDLIADHTPTRPELTYNGYVDYQFAKQWKSGVRLTTGINWNHITNTANITGTHQTDNVAAYLQYDHRIANRLSLSAGVRLEYYRMDDQYKEANIQIGNWLCPVRPVFRAGLNWEIYKAGFLRASFGQGYRNPSITEKFARKDIGGVGVYPNKDIKPESGYNAELGYKQLYKFGPVSGVLDVAGFYTEYQNMIEYQFGLFRNSDYSMVNSMYDVIDEVKQMIDDFSTTKSLKGGIGIGAQFVNVSHARIYGVEVGTTGKVDIKKDMALQYNIGYTFTEPEDMDNDKRIEQEKTYTDPLQMKNKSNDSKYLKYRNHHSFKTTIDFNYKWFSIGTNLSYRSKILAVDYLMVDERVKDQKDLMDYARMFIFGYEDGLSLHDYWMEHNTGIFTMDLRASVRFKEHVEVQFLINNLLNTEYSYRPMALAPPRTFVCRMNITL